MIKQQNIQLVILAHRYTNIHEYTHITRTHARTHTNTRMHYVRTFEAYFYAHTQGADILELRSFGILRRKQL